MPLVAPGAAVGRTGGRPVRAARHAGVWCRWVGRVRRRTVRVASDGGDQDGDAWGALGPQAKAVQTGLARIAEAQSLARQGGGAGDGWIELAGSWVRLPRGRPTVGVVHFVGGALLGQYPQVVYDRMLRRLADASGFAVIATPYELRDLDHGRLVGEVAAAFEDAHQALLARFGYSSLLPVVAIGHSLGAKLLALALSASSSSSSSRPRAGLVALAFNNASIKDTIQLVVDTARLILATPGERDAAMEGALPFLQNFADRFTQSMGIEFTPSPRETEATLSAGLTVPLAHVVRFEDDKVLDQSSVLTAALQTRFAGGYPEGRQSSAMLPGNHLAPVLLSLDDLNLSDLPPQLRSTFANAKFAMGDEDAVEALVADLVTVLAQETDGDTIDV